MEASLTEQACKQAVSAQSTSNAASDPLVHTMRVLEGICGYKFKGEWIASFEIIQAFFAALPYQTPQRRGPALASLVTPLLKTLDSLHKVCE